MTRFVPVKLAGPSALALLGENTHGTVLSSHATGLYCRFGNSIVLIHEGAFGLIPFGLGCAPFSVQSPSLSGNSGWNHIPPGTSATNDAQNRTLRVGGTVFNYTNATTPLPPFPWEGYTPNINQLQRGFNVAEKKLTVLENGGIATSYSRCRREFFSFLPPAEPFTDMWECAVWEPLQNLLRHCLENCDNKNTERFVMGLVGLGPGLTPLADDIVCGILATARVLAHPFPTHALTRLNENVAPTVARCLRGATTSQSAAFLASAAAGERFGMLDSLISAVYTAGVLPANDHSDVKRDKQTLSLDMGIKHVLNVGHSSGSGYLLGVLFAIHIALEHSTPNS